MILYIHGFSSSGLSYKSKLFRENFGEIISPTLSNIPDLAIDTLEQIIKFSLHVKKPVHLVGSSIGGYMSIYLANKYNLKAVLINPAITPYNFTMFTGFNECAYDGSKFESTCKHLEDLKKYDVATLKNLKNFLVLLQKGDELLNYKEAEEKFKNSNLIVEEGGTHSFDNLSSKLNDIKTFFGLE